MESTLGKAVDVFTCCVFTLNAFTIVLPAFLVAGALVVFVPSYSVMKYLGAKANRILSYGVAAVSGNVLTVCSCNVVPIFAGILRRGAGIGPAFCFVFAAPAIHVVNTVFTYQVIGLRLAIWRFLTVPVIAVVVGLVMAFAFRRDEAARQSEIQARSNVALLEQDPEETRRALLFLGLLIAVLFFGAWLSLDAYFPPEVGQYIRLGGVIVALGLLVMLATRWFGREETVEWGRQSWLLLRMIVPIFIVVVIIIGFVVSRIPLSWVMGTAADQGGLRFGHPEGNRILPVFLSAVFGTLMYFPMLTEVAFTKGLLKEAHFAVGPALALLLGGPGLSLPGLILVSKVAGWKKTVVYWVTMVTLITAAAYVFGARYGEYLCSCQLAGQATTAAHKAGPVGIAGLAWIIGLLAWITIMIIRAKGPRAEADALREQV